MRGKKIFAGIAIAMGIGVMAPGCVSFMTANSVVEAEAVTLAASGSLPCENGETIQYTFDNGVLTISGKGDKLVNKTAFEGNKEIKKVIFTDDCTMKNLDIMFSNCENLSTVENIPETVTSLFKTFSGTALTEVPKLPSHLETLHSTFHECTGITEVDFSKLPSSITNYNFAFQGTSVTNVTISFPEPKEPSVCLQFMDCFSYCQQLKTMVFDASNVNVQSRLLLGDLCSHCSALESFELKNFPDNHSYPGVYSSDNMFQNCENLVSVKCEGYFYSLGSFCNCKKLKTIDTKGFTHVDACYEWNSAFMNCEALEGTYYIQLADFSEIYRGFYENKNLDGVKEALKYTFKGCSDKVTFYVGCKPLVDYCNSLKTQKEYQFDANVLYWEEGDTYKKADSTTAPTVTETPTVSSNPSETPKPTKTVTATAEPITNTTVTKVTVSTAKKKVILRWKKKANVTGYQIYRKTGNGKYKLVKTIKKASTVKWTDRSVKSKKTYSYKIRAYKVKNKKKTYSKFSSEKKVKVE